MDYINIEVKIRMKPGVIAQIVGLGRRTLRFFLNTFTHMLHMSA